jgi:FdhD protein
MPRSTVRPLLTVRGHESRNREDRVAVEDPLEIRALGPGQDPVQLAVTMRTPGDDVELAVGFLVGEGLLHRRDELGTPVSRELALEGSPSSTITLRLARAFDAERLKRNFYATSSCGICGKAAIEHIYTEAPELRGGPTVPRSVLESLPAELRRGQQTFAETGGVHATAAFDARGGLITVREDVGRHNAMDKVIGRLFLDGMLPLSEGILLVSGRASFELVQKAAMAGVPVLCAVSAPSSLAVQTAEKVGMTLVGFLRPDGFNVYASPDRIAMDR